MVITQPRRLFWKTFGVLMVGALVGVLGIFPYALTLQAPLLRDLDIELPPLWVLVPIQALQSLVLIGGATALGLWLGPKVGLGAPLVTGLVSGDPDARARVPTLLAPAAGMGVLTAVVIVVLDAGVFAPQLPDLAASAVQPPAWQGFLASFYGGIVEELLLRLGLMTLLVWVGMRVSRAMVPSTGVVWFAIVVTALLFGLGHLPATAALTALTPLVVVRALLLNGLGGLVFGWLYAKRGLLAAMLAHFCADLVLHVAAPIVLR